MRRRRSQALAALACLVLAGACRSDSGLTESSSGRAAGITTTTTTTQPTGSPTTTSAPAPAGSPTTTATPGTTSAGNPTAAGAGGSTTVPAGAGARRAFAAPGTYRYTSIGRFSTTLTGPQPRDGEVILTVDPPTGNDQHSVRQGPGRTTEQVLRLQDGNAYVASLRLAELGMTKEIRPNPPGLVLPADVAPGRTWSWRATSTDGLTEIRSEFRAVRTEDVAVGPQRVATMVVEVLVTLTGDVTASSTQELWVAAGHGLVVRQEDTTEGRLGGVAFTTSSTETLVSLDPS